MKAGLCEPAHQVVESARHVMAVVVDQGKGVEGILGDYQITENKAAVWL
jgi:hypothetical protein